MQRTIAFVLQSGEGAEEHKCQAHEHPGTRMSGSHRSSRRRGWNVCEEHWSATAAMQLRAIKHCLPDATFLYARVCGSNQGGCVSPAQLRSSLSVSAEMLGVKRISSRQCAAPPQPRETCTQSSTDPTPWNLVQPAPASRRRERSGEVQLPALSS